MDEASIKQHPWYVELAIRFDPKQGASPTNTIKEHVEVNPCCIPKPKHKLTWSAYHGRSSKVRHIFP